MVKSIPKVGGRNKEDKENQIFPILRKRKHVSGVVSTNTFGGSSG